MMQPDIAESMRFLRLLYGNVDTGWLQIWTLQDKTSHWLDLSTEFWGHAAHNLLERVADESDTYVRMSPLSENLGPRQRGTAEQAAGIPALWLDFDIADPVAHKKGNLPESLGEILDLLDTLELPPTIVVNSGWGVHAYWLLREYWAFESEYSAAAALVQRWQGYVRNKAAERGWVIDSVHDMARVMRLPGTINRKNPDDHRLATILSAPADATATAYAAYNPSDIRAYLDINDVPHPLEVASRGPYKVQGGVILTGEYNLPFSKLDALLTNDPRFRRTWERRRGDIQDQSASSYDLALANALVAVAWTDSEIAAAMVAWRQKHSEDTAKVTERSDYLRNTIGRARTGRQNDTTAGPETDAILTAVAVAATPAETADAKAAALDAAGRKIGVKLEAAYLNLGAPPTYSVVIGGQEFGLGEGNKMLSADTLRAAMLSAHMPPFLPVKLAFWGQFLQLLAPALVDRDTGISAVDIATEVINGYLRGGISDEFADAAEARWPFRDDGRVHLWQDRFYQWAAGQPDRPDRKQVNGYLTVVGAELVRLFFTLKGGKRAQPKVWRLPPNFGQPEEEVVQL